MTSALLLSIMMSTFRVTRNVLASMEKNGVKNIIFTSSVAVYGLNKHNPDENHPHDPFNHYGKSKWQAE